MVRLGLEVSSPLTYLESVQKWPKEVADSFQPVANRADRLIRIAGLSAASPEAAACLFNS